MSIYKSIEPLKNGDKQFFPLTSADQVIKKDGTRLEGADGVNADLLNGKAADYYATKSDCDTALSQSIYQYTHTPGKLAGIGVNGKFKATTTETVSTILINDKPYLVKQGEEAEIELIKDCWYTFILDDTTINFNTGGANLNFKIIGNTTHPASPKENTIWVSTDIAIGEYQFSATEPTTKENGLSLQLGDLWLMTSEKGVSPFNIIKKPAVEVNVIAISQWNGTAWVGKDAYIYKNNEWRIFGEFLYYLGNEVKAVTGGFSTDGYLYHTSVSSANKLEKYDNYLIFGIPSNYGDRTGGAMGTFEKIDFTPYREIKITLFNTTTMEEKVLIFDLTSINNYYYFACCVDYNTHGVNFVISGVKYSCHGNQVTMFKPEIFGIKEMGLKKIQLIR